ncbi:MAG: DUF1292 domain-containing protein [Bacilli bacterium]|nr:DUF1292 domain-containing protein [Bacilli bacterium]
MEDTFVTTNPFGLEVRCKILGNFELEGDTRKFIAYTDYKYNKDLKYNVYFSELVSKNGDDIILASIDDEEILNAITEMYNEGVGGKNE